MFVDDFEFYSEEKLKRIAFCSLAFLEFLSNLHDIYRVDRSAQEVLEDIQKCRFFTHKPNILTKMHIFDFSKMAILWGMRTKIEF